MILNLFIIGWVLLGIIGWVIVMANYGFNKGVTVIDGLMFFAACLSGPVIIICHITHYLITCNNGYIIKPKNLRGK
jgi:hypothetical protein